MNKNLLLLLVLLLFVGCTTTDDEPKPEGFGELIREGYPTEMNPFQILKETAHEGQIKVDFPTIIAEDVGDHYPLKLFNTPYAYIFSLKVPAEDYTKDEYLISLRTLTKDFKDCSEAKEVTFYRFAEEDGIAEYRSYLYINGEEKGIYLFLAQREMPSYEWYKVLKVCSTEENKGFRLEGVVL